MEAVLAFLAEYALELGGGAAAIAILEKMFHPIGWIFGRKKSAELAQAPIVAPVQANDGLTLSIPDFIRLRGELKADIERDLETADESEKSQL